MWSLRDLGPTVFNIFKSDVHDEIRCTLKFHGDAKLSEEVDTLESHPAQVGWKIHQEEMLYYGKHNPGVQNPLASILTGD